VHKVEQEKQTAREKIRGEKSNSIPINWLVLVHYNPTTNQNGFFVVVGGTVEVVEEKKKTRKKKYTQQLLFVLYTPPSCSLCPFCLCNPVLLSVVVEGFPIYHDRAVRC
jgi:hypothetical protein